MITPQFGIKESDRDKFLSKNLNFCQLKLFTDCIPSLGESLFSKGINSKSTVFFTYSFDSLDLIYNERKLSNLGVKFIQGKFTHDFEGDISLMEWRYFKTSEISYQRSSVFIVMSMFPEISIEETAKLVNNARDWIGETEGVLYLVGTLKGSNEPFMKIVVGF